MTHQRGATARRRSWIAGGGLAAVLAVLVVGQVSATSTGDRLLRAPVDAAVDALVAAPPAAAAPAGPTASAAVGAASVGASSPGSPGAERPAAGAGAGADAGTGRPDRAGTPGAGPPAAAAPTPAVAAADLCSGTGWEQRRGNAALASLRAGAERTGFRVEFTGARTGYLGLTHLEQRRIEIFVRPCGVESDELLRHVIAHELGHAYDTTRMGEETRQAWQVARGIPLSTPWYGCSGCTDFATPAGDFAEVYAQWARGASSNRSELAGDVAPGALAALADRFFGA